MGRFYLDKEKDVSVDLQWEGERLSYVLRTPNHHTGNLITNLARLCGLPLSFDTDGLKVIRGEIPCYVDGDNRKVYIFRLGNTKVANIFPDGTVEVKAQVPAISKTLMSQTKDYTLDEGKTLVKTYILSDVKFTTDLHTHMNGNLDPDILIALGIMHQIRYPFYYVKKLGLHTTPEQLEGLLARREEAAKALEESTLSGKYLERRIDDNTFLNFADLILGNLPEADYNIARIRPSLTIPKDGQAVFANLEKVYLYRYVFTKGEAYGTTIPLDHEKLVQIPNADVVSYLLRMEQDRAGRYPGNTLFQDKLLWIARSYQARGIRYAEVTDTTLVKRTGAIEMLRQVHALMPRVTEETGVLLRFLAGIRRIPLTIVKDEVTPNDYLAENLEVLAAIAPDPYVAGADIIGEEINDIRELSPLIRQLVRLAGENDGFVIRIHAGENDSLRGNVYNSLHCVIDCLEEGQAMPPLRIGHGLYTGNLGSPQGKKLLQDLIRYGVVLEFQITSNVRLNNLSDLRTHPLKAYLRAGVGCVQGTDGGALYGTDSIDEELALTKLLELTHEELLRMRATDAAIEEKSRVTFRKKKEALEQECAALGPKVWTDAEKAERVCVYLKGRLSMRISEPSRLWLGGKEWESREVFKDLIREIPATGLPIVIAGGSFHSDRHQTVVREEGRLLLDRLLEKGDPEKIFFVVGHCLRGYEQYLVEQGKGRFQVFAFVPTKVSEGQRQRLLSSGVSIRLAIESSGIGIYKSIAYEVFKRRFSVLLAFDGNSAAANLVQEAKNAKNPCQMYLNPHCRTLLQKAKTLKGYVRMLEDPEATAEEILRL